MDSAPMLLLSNFLPRLPLIIVWMVGIGIAFANYERHTKVSLLAVSGFGLSIVTSVGSALFYSFYVPQMMRSAGTSSTGVVMGIVGGITTVLGTVAWIAIVVAVFSGRSRS